MQVAQLSYFMFAFKAAHAENMTFNDWMNKMLKSFIDKVEKEPLPQPAQLVFLEERQVSHSQMQHASHRVVP